MVKDTNVGHFFWKLLAPTSRPKQGAEKPSKLGLTKISSSKASYKHQEFTGGM